MDSGAHHLNGCGLGSVSQPFGFCPLGWCNSRNATASSKVERQCGQITASCRTISAHAGQRASSGIGPRLVDKVISKPITPKMAPAKKPEIPLAPLLRMMTAPASALLIHVNKIIFIRKSSIDLSPSLLPLSSTASRMVRRQTSGVYHHPIGRKTAEAAHG